MLISRKALVLALLSLCFAFGTQSAHAYLVWILPGLCCNDGLGNDCPGGDAGALVYAHGAAVQYAQSQSRALNDRVVVKDLEQHGCPQSCSCPTSGFRRFTFRFKITQTLPQYQLQLESSSKAPSSGCYLEV